MLRENYNLTKAQLVDLMLYSALLATKCSPMMKKKYIAKVEAVLGKGALFDVMCEGQKIMAKTTSKYKIGG